MRLADFVSSGFMHLTNNSRVTETNSEINSSSHQDFLSGRYSFSSIPGDCSVMTRTGFVENAGSLAYLIFPVVCPSQNRRPRFGLRADFQAHVARENSKFPKHTLRPPRPSPAAPRLGFRRIRLHRHQLGIELRRRLRHRFIRKPIGNVLVIDAPPGHNRFPLLIDPAPIARQIPERFQRLVLMQQTCAEHHQIACCDG